jgi:DNA-directed RNA polymerase II subunit RPB2
MEELYDVAPDVIPKATKIFVNGSWVGVHRNPEELVCCCVLLCLSAVLYSLYSLSVLSIHSINFNFCCAQVSTLRSLRRSVNFPVEVSVVWDMRDKELRLQCDAGRCCRPLFVVHNQRLKITKTHIRTLQEKALHASSGGAGGDTNHARWSELINQGLIEYIDCDEVCVVGCEWLMCVGME